MRDKIGKGLFVLGLFSGMIFGLWLLVFGRLVTNETTILYVLTTLAQSCAALAAFVGAVGVFRLQMLRDEHGEAEENMRRIVVPIGVLHQDAASWLPIERVVEELERLRPRAASDDSARVAVRALDDWRALTPLQDGTRRALIGLEVWNLGVIGLALVGFNYVPCLAAARWFRGLLAMVAVGTVFVPLWCVWVWTERVEK